MIVGVWDVKPLKFSDYTDSACILQASIRQYLLLLIVSNVERTTYKGFVHYNY